MAWVIIRTATAEDHDALNKSARRFADRHNIPISLQKSTWDIPIPQLHEQVSDHIEFRVGSDYYNHEAKALRRLWWRCIARATGCKGAEGIAWGSIGYSSKE